MDAKDVKAVVYRRRLRTGRGLCPDCWQAPGQRQPFFDMPSNGAKKLAAELGDHAIFGQHRCDQ